MPQIAIVVPSYNHAAYLGACLGSIQAQTFTDWQVMLIDDGSRDESVEIARSFARDDKRIRVETNPSNLGTYGTQQRGLEISESPLVAIMNSDDLWAPTKLERQVELLRRYPQAPLAYVLGAMVDEAGKSMEGEDVHRDWPRAEVQETLPFLLAENRILASGALFRRQGLRFETSCRYSGDWVALIERSYAGPLACVPERLTFWRQHATNTYRASTAQMLEEIRVREAISRARDAWFVPRFDATLVRHGLAANAMHLAALYAYFGQRSLVRRTAWQALRDGFPAASAVKRGVGGLLSKAELRKRIWGSRAPELPFDQAEVLLRENSPLVLNL